METKKNITDYIKLKEKIHLDENYFEDFKTDFLLKIKSESEKSESELVVKQAKQQTKIIILKPIFWISSIAASIVFIFGINYFMNNNSKLSEFSDSEILANVEENSDDFTIEEIQSQIEKSTKNRNQSEIDTIKAANNTSEIQENVQQENQIPKASFNELLNSFTEEDLYLYLNSDEVDLEDIEIL